MRVTRSLRLSLRALSNHRLRTALAIAGTAIGVGGVLVLTAIGEAARVEVVRRIESLGRNMLVVAATKIDRRAGRTIQGEGWRQDLRVADAAAILRGSGAVVRAAPAQDRALPAKFDAVRTPTTVLGTTPDWQAIREFPLARGRFFTEGEAARRARVAVLGAEVHTSLFPDSVNPLGKTVRVGSAPFEVVGVLARKGVSVDGAANEDDRIVVPLETAMRRLFSIDYIQMIYLEASSAAAMAAAETEVAAILRARHDVRTGVGDGFVIQDQRLLLDAELAAQTSFRKLVMGLGFLALIVGGIGILSIMLLSIRGRRAEIGLRVAIGARRRDIITQFLAESLVLAAAGGVIGVVLGSGAARLVSAVTTWDARVSAVPLGVATLSAAAVGLLFGVLPAWRAAKLDPIEALHAE